MLLTHGTPSLRRLNSVGGVNGRLCAEGANDKILNKMGLSPYEGIK